ncbi:uncharacterized protein TM35_000491230 [Trypanosoma theileri]|uniref:Uncharacterized protein n=1 Tax=Trypanosoma theileri TaxID=67003 RepID=A0A1X0NHI8_9TRYP|nr:uncharacterized protein TM35_000491230 [Trypanosoma theileri]ORC84117.1 hypothetical protein TM35_000491230 [Trypanosoma theileri]
MPTTSSNEEAPIIITAQTPPQQRDSRASKNIFSHRSRTTSPKRCEAHSSLERPPAKTPPLPSLNNTNTNNTTEITDTAENAESTTINRVANNNTPPAAAVIESGPTEESTGDDWRDTLGKTYSGCTSHHHHNNNFLNSSGSSSNHHSRTTSGAPRSFLGRFVHMLKSSGSSKSSRKGEDGPRNEPYDDEDYDHTPAQKSMNSDHNSGVEDNPNHTPLATTKTATTSTPETEGNLGCTRERTGADGEMISEENGNKEEGYYYTTETGEVYYVDPTVLVDVGHEEEEGEEGEEEEKEEKEEQQLDVHQVVKGKAVKTLIAEESKARKRLQQDSLIVLADIGRTYRAMSRSVTNGVRDEKTLRRVLKRLEKDAVKGARVIEGEWKKEHTEMIHTFRTTIEAYK